MLTLMATLALPLGPSAFCFLHARAEAAASVNMMDFITAAVACYMDLKPSKRWIASKCH
jgi:hypothetical protein